MSKEVLISIRPEWVKKILAGEKTLEVRKTRPKLETPFKVYIYCTSGRPDLNIPISPERLMQDYLDTGSMRSLNCPLGNGKVIGEFVCDKIDVIRRMGIPENFDYCYLSLNEWGNDDIETEIRAISASCVSKEELNAYGAKAPLLYGWHISDLKIYEMPKELTEFHTWKKCKSCSKSGYESTACIYDENCMVPVAITKAPQSWYYVEELK